MAALRALARLVLPLLAVSSSGESVSTLRHRLDPRSESTASALALAAVGRCLSGDEAAAAWLLAGSLVGGSPGAERLRRNALDHFDFARDSAASSLAVARMTGSDEDWSLALADAASLGASEWRSDRDDAFFSAAVASAPRDGARNAAMLAAALLAASPGDPRGPEEFRRAIRLGAAAPAAIPPERLFIELSSILRRRHVRVGEAPALAQGAVRLAAVLREEAPPERRGACAEALVDDAILWGRLERDGDEAALDGLAISLLEEAHSFGMAPFAEVTSPGDALFAAGDTNGAVRAWMAELERSGHPRIRSFLANNVAYVSAVSGGDLDEALRLSDEALSVRPLDSAALDTLAWIFHLRGDAENAFLTMRKALVRSGDEISPDVRLHAAAILRSLRKYSAAAEWMRGAFNP